MNVWGPLPRKVDLEWESIHGIESCVQFALNVPPKAIAGRWGAISASEAFLDDRGEHLTKPVLAAVFPHTWEKRANV